MSNSLAVVNGGLANKSQFFGSNTSEVTSSLRDNGGWNLDWMHLVGVTRPWSLYGAHQTSPDGSVRSGMFSAGNSPGNTQAFYGHRTILLGY
ncbi:hypothetical protein FWG76_00145 [Candidatus Saccharibacteria bacterium]|nr:hypothetical protein [Candidatus Saccharibacteria bacterium]